MIPIISRHQKHSQVYRETKHNVINMRYVHIPINNTLYEKTQQVRRGFDKDLETKILEYCKHFQDAIFRDDRLFSEWTLSFYEKYGFVLHEDSLQILLDTLHTEARHCRSISQYKIFVEMLFSHDDLKVLKGMPAGLRVKADIYNNWLNKQFQLPGNLPIEGTISPKEKVISEQLSDCLEEISKKYSSYAKFPPQAKTMIDEFQSYYIKEVNLGKNLSVITENLAQMKGYYLNNASFCILINRIADHARTQFSNRERELFYKKILNLDDIGVLERSGKKNLTLTKEANFKYSAYLEKQYIPKDVPAIKNEPEVWVDGNPAVPRDVPEMPHNKLTNLNKPTINLSANPPIINQDPLLEASQKNAVNKPLLSKNSPLVALNDPTTEMHRKNLVNNPDTIYSNKTSVTHKEPPIVTFSQIASEPTTIQNCKPEEITNVDATPTHGKVVEKSGVLPNIAEKDPSTHVSLQIPERLPEISPSHDQNADFSNSQIAVLTLICFAVIFALAFYERVYHPERAVNANDSHLKEQENAENKLYSVLEPMFSFHEILIKLFLCVIPLVFLILYQLRYYYFFRLLYFFKK